MAGYKGYSMSNNAVSAYVDGEKPKSKWTKSAIVDMVGKLIIEDDLDLDIKVVSTMNKEELCDTFLKWSSWHHTSSMYNKTDFYEVVVPDNITNDMIKDIVLNRAVVVKDEKPAVYYAEVVYGEWEGTRKRPKLVEYTAQAVIQGNNAYILPLGVKKLVSGKHFNEIKTYTRKPKHFDTVVVSKIKKKFIK